MEYDERISDELVEAARIGNCRALNLLSAALWRSIRNGAATVCRADAEDIAQERIAGVMKAVLEDRGILRRAAYAFTAGKRGALSVVRTQKRRAEVDVLPGNAGDLPSVEARAEARARLDELQSKMLEDEPLRRAVELLLAVGADDLALNDLAEELLGGSEAHDTLAWRRARNRVDAMICRARRRVRLALG